MRGMEDARKLVAAALAAGLPAKVAELAARLGLPPTSTDGIPVPGSLPPPGTVVANERPEIEAWPAVFTVPLRIVGIKHVDEVDGYETLAVRYRLRTYFYARAQGFDDVRDQADRLTLAGTEVLLFSTELDHAGAKTDPTSFSGEFSGIDAIDQTDQVASAYLEYDVTLEESLRPAPPPLGPPIDAEADTIVVETVPPHPALD